MNLFVAVLREPASMNERRRDYDLSAYLTSVLAGPFRDLGERVQSHDEMENASHSDRFHLGESMADPFGAIEQPESMRCSLTFR